MTLLRRSVAKETYFHGTPIIQSCRGMHSTVELSLEIVNLHIRGLKESENFKTKDVKLTDVVPELYHLLPSDFAFDTHDNFTGIPHHTINRDCCDMVIGEIICTYLPLWRSLILTASLDPFTRFTHRSGELYQAAYLKMSITFKY